MRSALAFQRQGERALFGPIKAFVESAGRDEGLPRAEHKGAARESGELRQRDGQNADKPDVKRGDPVRGYRRPSACGPMIHISERGSHGASVDDGIGVHEKQSLAACRAAAGIAGCGDLPMMNIEDGGAVPAGYFGGSVRRSIVHDDDQNELGKFMPAKTR